jgi:hypothetical protein
MLILTLMHVACKKIKIPQFVRDIKNICRGVRIPVRFHKGGAQSENLPKQAWFKYGGSYNEVREQILSHLSNNSTYTKMPFPVKFPESKWVKVNEGSYEYGQIDSNKLKATFSALKRELIYLK